jgi:hypothetical protein
MGVVGDFSSRVNKKRLPVFGTAFLSPAASTSFSDNFDGGSGLLADRPGWALLSGSSTAYALNGQRVVAQNTATEMVAPTTIFATNHFAQAVLEARHSLGEDENGFSYFMTTILLIDYINANNYTYVRAFESHAAGSQFSIVNVVNGAAAATFNSATPNGQTTGTYRAEASNDIKLYFNGQLRLTAPRSNPSTRVGLIAIDNQDAQIDDFSAGNIGQVASPFFGSTAPSWGSTQAQFGS